MYLKHGSIIGLMMTLGCMQPSCTGGKSHYLHGCYICVLQRRRAIARIYFSLMFVLVHNSNKLIIYYEFNCRLLPAVPVRNDHIQLPHFNSQLWYSEGTHG
jgi:hypothetical protein